MYSLLIFLKLLSESVKPYEKIDATPFTFNLLSRKVLIASILLFPVLIKSSIRTTD